MNCTSCRELCVSTVWYVTRSVYLCGSSWQSCSPCGVMMSSTWGGSTGRRRSLCLGSSLKKKQHNNQSQRRVFIKQLWTNTETSNVPESLTAANRSARKQTDVTDGGRKNMLEEQIHQDSSGLTNKFNKQIFKML